MFEPFYYFYFGLLIFTGALYGISYAKGDKKSIYIIILLTATLLFEATMVILRNEHVKHYIFIYDFFPSVEYTLFCLYYLKATPVKWTRILTIISVMAFFIFSLTTAILVFRFEAQYAKFITWNINLEGFLLFIVYTHLLFSIDHPVMLPIYKYPEFWICVGVLIFYGGIFVLLGLYPILLNIANATAGHEYGFILRPLNVIFYICMIGGSICFLQNKKYLIQ